VWLLGRMRSCAEPERNDDDPVPAPTFASACVLTSAGPALVSV
jgi:hypothetical protein